MKKSSLGRQLVLPYVALVLFVSAAIGWVSYRAGVDAVATLSRRILTDTANHIGTVTEQHLETAELALRLVYSESASPASKGAFPDDLASLESRLWLACDVYSTINAAVYFGGGDGRFIGIRRANRDLAELYLREPQARQRRVFASATPGDRGRVLRVDRYDARVRPWYRAAASSERPVWSPVYNDFTTGEATITLAKSVHRSDQSFAGVLATDVTLKGLSDLLRSLNKNDHGVAFIVDGDGFIVATSMDEASMKSFVGTRNRLHPDEMQSPLIRDVYAAFAQWQRSHPRAAQPMSQELATKSGPIEMAATSITHKSGIDWTVIVTAPRSDFMAGVTRSFIEGTMIAAVCVIAALVLGLAILNQVLLDLRKLSNAAKLIGEGEPLPSLDINRRDEIGQLATRFSELEHSLRIDKLTAVFNRASLTAQIALLKRQLGQLHGERPSFALLFIDLDHFKAINDRYGHDAGDKVLATVAARLKEAVRVTDVVARYGGDEFVLLLKGVNTESDVLGAEAKIRAAVEKAIPLEHGIAEVGVSLGWAMFPDDGEDVDALLKMADQRMYQSKRQRKIAQNGT